jgi:hypothetical protein
MGTPLKWEIMRNYWVKKYQIFIWIKGGILAGIKNFLRKKSYLGLRPKMPVGAPHQGGGRDRTGTEWAGKWQFFRCLFPS